MGREDWYRNEQWNTEIEAEFNTRIRRARVKFQYLRIQASYLVKTYPEVALHLLEQYFSLGEHFDLALAHCHRAEAYLALGEVWEAVAAYEAALLRESQFRYMETRAFFELPKLIAVEHLTALFVRGLEILEMRKTSLVFPADRYLWHGSKAIILDGMGDADAAKDSAELALKAASETTSGFQRHPSVGLVWDQESQFRRHLQMISRPTAKP